VVKCRSTANKPSAFRNGKNYNDGLPGAERISTICLAVLTLYRTVEDRQRNGQTEGSTAIPISSLALLRVCGLMIKMLKLVQEEEQLYYVQFHVGRDS